MQVRRLLEPDDHITISLPPLFIDIFGQVPRESARREIRIAAELLKVVHTEGNDVFVGRQKALSLKGRTPSSASLRNRASISCGTIDPPNIRANASPTVASSLRSMRAASPFWLHRGYHRSALARTCRGISPARGKRLCARRITQAWYRDSATMRHREILRIASCSSESFCSAPAAWAPVGAGTSDGWGARPLSGMVLRLFRASGGMADALASGASVLRDVGVQVPLRPPM